MYRVFVNRSLQAASIDEGFVAFLTKSNRATEKRGVVLQFFGVNTTVSGVRLSGVILARG